MAADDHPYQIRTLSLEPQKLISALQDGEIDPHYITHEQRRPTVAWMRARGYPKAEVAALFGVHPDTIRLDWRKIEKQGLMEMGAVSVRAIGFGHTSRLYAMYEEAMANHRDAKVAKDYAASTSALCEARKTLDAIKKILQDLGLLYKEPDRVRVEVLARDLFMERLATLAALIQEHVPAESREALAIAFEEKLDFPLKPEDES